jgi:cell shape-determining protein MreC
MTSDEKVLNEIKEYFTKIIEKIAELKVTEQERQLFEKDKEDYIKLIHDYKKHKAALLEKYA